MHGQPAVGRRHYLVQPVYVALYVLVFVLLDDGAQPVAVVVQKDADDGKSSQGVALCSV